MLAIDEIRRRVGQSVRHHRGVEQIEIRHVGQQAAVQRIVVRQRCRSARNQTCFCGGCGCALRNSRRLHRAEFEGPLRTRAGGAARRQMRQSSRGNTPATSGSPSGRRHIGHGDLVIEALLPRPGTSGHVEDLLAVLDRDDAARREMIAVACAVDFIDDRRVEIAAPQEIGMQRVHCARSTVALAATNAWPSTWPPKTCGLPMSRLSPRNRLSSSRSSVITLTRSCSSWFIDAFRSSTRRRRPAASA